MAYDRFQPLQASNKLLQHITCETTRFKRNSTRMLTKNCPNERRLSMPDPTDRHHAFECNLCVAERQIIQLREKQAPPPRADTHSERKNSCAKHSAIQADQRLFSGGLCGAIQPMRFPACCPEKTPMPGSSTQRDGSMPARVRVSAASRKSQNMFPNVAIGWRGARSNTLGLNCVHYNQTTWRVGQQLMHLRSQKPLISFSQLTPCASAHFCVSG